MLISVEGTDKYQLKKGQENKGVLQCCHIVLCYEILDLNRPVCWSIVMIEKPLLVLHFSGRFLLTALLPRRKKSMYISLLTVLPSGMNSYQRTPVNYTTEFREFPKATTVTPCCKVFMEKLRVARDLGFLQRWWRRFSSCGTLRRIDRWIVADVSKDRSSFIFRFKQSELSFLILKNWALHSE
jgi:hypothetical protein